VGWSDPRFTLATEPCAKVGSSSPFRCFARVQNQPSRETQPPCSVQLPFTAEVKGAVNRTVNHVFHAPFTIPLHKQLLEWVGGNYDPRVFSIEAVNRVLHG